MVYYFRYYTQLMISKGVPKGPLGRRFSWRINKEETNGSIKYEKIIGSRSSLRTPN
jgi:hypothetical protein